MTSRINQELALTDELSMSATLIKQGFGELQEMQFEDLFYYVPHQLLASGFERVMKCYLILMYELEHKRFPSSKKLKDYGHDLCSLKNKVLEKCKIIKDTALLKEDYAFVENDSLLDKALTILSEFGKQARYYNLNVVTGSKQEPISPDSEWESLQSSLVDFAYDDIEQSLGFASKANCIIIAKLERFARFMSRLLVCEIKDNDFKFYSVSFNVCRGMMDDDFGTSDYRRSVELLKKKKDTWHKRTKEDILQGQWPAKVITKEAFTEEWPFRKNVTEVVVELQKKLAVVINIHGVDFALNGIAMSWLNYPDPHDAGIAIIGKSIGSFTDIAFALKEQENE